MTNYKNIFGKPVKFLATDPDNAEAEGQIWYNSTSDAFKSIVSLEAFSSASPLTTGRDERAAGAGTQTAGLSFGGVVPPAAVATNSVTTSEEYNGSGWSAGGNIPTGGWNMAGCGTLTAALGFSGVNPGGNLNNTNEYDGTSWTAGGNLNTAGRAGGGFGTQTAAVNAGRPGSAVVEEYNGTSWSEVNDIPTATYMQAAAGSQTAGTVAGGQPATSQQVLGYDGTNWTTLTSLNEARNSTSYAGDQNDFLIMGGNNNLATTTLWNGTTHTANANMANGRGPTGSATNAIQPTGNGSIVSGGYNGATTINAAEEYNRSINVITGAAWSAGGNLNNGRSHASGSGDKNSMVVAGGVGTTPDYSLTEEYNGSSWTTATSMPSGRYYVSGSGTQTAAIALGGRTPPNAVGNDTFEYNGTSWTSGGNYPTNIERSFGNGTQTASLASGGSTGPSVVSAANIYDGSSWTSTGSLTTPNMGSGSCGTTSASLNVGGFLGPAPTKTDRTEEFNGSTWATGTSFPSVIEGGGVAGIQTSAIIFGGKTPSLTTNSFTYDGTSYATNPSLGTARYAFALGTVGNTIGTAIGAGGYLSPGRAAQTEEFTGKTTALNLKTLTTS